MGIRDAINTQDSDIDDVLARIAYSAYTMTTENRAMLGRRRIEDAPDEKIAAILDFVIDHNFETGAERLDRSMLADYLQLKFGTLDEEEEVLGSLDNITSDFRGICMPGRTNSNAIKLMFKASF